MTTVYVIPTYCSMSSGTTLNVVSFPIRIYASVASQKVDREDLEFFLTRKVDIRFNYNVHGLGPVENVLRWRLSAVDSMLPLHLHPDRLI